MVVLIPSPGRRRFRILVLGALLAAAAPPAAAAFDFFGLFGREEPPAPAADRLSYTVAFEVAGGEREVRNAVEGASRLQDLRQDPPPDAEALVLRARADLPRIVDALWGQGYYAARVAVVAAGVPLSLEADRSDAAVAALRPYQGRAVAPLEVRVEPGPRYAFRDVAVLDARSGAPLLPPDLPRRGPGIDPGDPARAADILAAEARIVDNLRAQSRPLAKVTRRDPVVVHPALALDVTLGVDPGPVAPFGAITVTGTRNVDPAVVRSFIYTEPGDPYSPAAVAGIRKSVGRIEALASVRVREADALDAAGRLPVFVEVTERLPRAISASAAYSTVDGPAIRASWTHRNLFGGAERLRIEGAIFEAERPRFGEVRRRKFDVEDIGGRFTASFLKPALGGTRNDFLADAVVARETTRGYQSRLAGGTLAIRHRFSDVSSAQAGVEFERGQAIDVLGKVDYQLVGLPVSLTLDDTDSLLDPTRGYRLQAAITPYPEALGSSVGFTVGRATGSAYFSFDEDGRYVLAGRVGLGSIVGAELEEIPANRRFFAGGGGSVRGFAYRSLGPRAFGEPIGGRSLFEGSLEARIKVTDTIGIVPFVDAGTAFRSSTPDFKERVRVAAGLGLRYYTGIGPIRLDVAVPVDRRERGDPTVSVYVSIGQAF